MNRYSVMIDPQYEAQLVPVSQLDPNALIEYVDTAADGSELWHVTTKHDIDTILDRQPGVVSYDVTDLDQPQYTSETKYPDA